VKKIVRLLIAALLLVEPSRRRRSRTAGHHADMFT